MQVQGSIKKPDITPQCQPLFGAVGKDVPDFHGKHALIIEDNVLNVEVLGTLLIQYGIAVTVFETPEHLQEYLSSSPGPDVIFLDLEFRHFDGVEIFLQLKEASLITDIPIIAYTVHISQINRVREAGFNGFLGKPLKMDDFAEHLHRIFEGLPVWDG